MLIDHPAQTCDAEITQAIEQCIARRTWNRIHQLSVEMVEGRIVVHGHTASYHAKQLALAGALEAMDSTPVELDIDVRASPRGYRACQAD